VVRQGVSPLAPLLAPVAPLGRERFSVSIKIDDGYMSLEIDGKVAADARQRTGGWWEVSYRPRFFDRNQAITALTSTELLKTGRDSNDQASRASRSPSGV